MTMRPYIASLLALVLVVAVAAPAHAFFSFGSAHKTVKPENGVIALDAAQFDDGKARFYQMEANGTTVKFFLVKSRDGVIRAAFDACDVCWREGEGYQQDGEFMTCVYCGRKFHSTRINVVSGGCNPAPLPRVEKDGKVLIKASDIAQGAHYFEGV